MRSPNPRNEIHTRRFHGRSASAQLSTCNLAPDFRTPNFSTSSNPVLETSSPIQTASRSSFNFSESHKTAPWTRPANAGKGFLEPNVIGAALKHGKWRLALALYVFVSVVVFSIDAIVGAQSDTGRMRSPKDELRILSKILPFSSPQTPNTLESFLLRDYGPLHPWSTSVEITACVVTEEDDLGKFDTWLERWNGPITLLVTTTSSPGSIAYNTLSRHILALRSSHRSYLPVLQALNYSASYNARRISAHLLSLPTQKGVASPTNLLLNLARMHATTASVMVFPHGLSYLPAPGLHNRLVNAQLGAHPRIIPRVVESKHHAYSQPALHNETFIDRDSALLIVKDYPLWCTDRFSVAFPRHSADYYKSEHLDEWAQCLWQVLLEHPDSLGQRDGDAYGISASSRASGIIWGDGAKEMDARKEGKATSHDGVQHTQARVHDRLVAHFRTEQCMFIARQYSAQGLWEQSSGATDTVGNTENGDVSRKVMHIRQMCAETLKLWGRYLLEK